MGNAPRICLFTSLYLPSMGGVETYTASLANALAQMGQRPIVVACATHGPAGIEASGGIDVVRLPCRALLNGRYPVPKRDAEARELWEWLSGQPVGHIVVNTRFYPLSLAGLGFAQEKGIVPVLIEHGSAHLTMGSPLVDKGVQAVEHAMTRRCLRRPARYYAVSRKASAWLGHFGIESCGELPNSIDADAYAAGASPRDFRSEFDLADGELLAAFVGRLVPEKGVRAIVEAARLLEGEGVVLALAGDGPLRGEAERSEGGALRLPMWPRSSRRPMRCACPPGRRGSRHRCWKRRPAAPLPWSPTWAAPTSSSRIPGSGPSCPTRAPKRWRMPLGGRRATEPRSPRRGPMPPSV